MKRLVAFLLLMGLALGVFIACGGGGDTPSTDTPATTTGTVRLSGSVAQ